MDRRAAAQAFSTAAAFGLALHAEAEAELASAREEAAQLRAALAQERDAHAQSKRIWHEETADYARTVTDLRTKLRDEEAHRAQCQAGYSAAVRLSKSAREVSRDGDPSSTESAILNVSARAWDALRAVVGA